jgi:transposase
MIKDKIQCKYIMVCNNKISSEQKALAMYLRMESRASYRKIARKCLISKSSAERICKIGLNSEAKSKRAKTGRPNKIDARTSRILVRSLKKCRKHNVNFDVKSLVKESGLSLQLASRRTFSRHLNLLGYRFLQARKKGLLTDKDRKRRLKFARKTKRLCLRENAHFWRDEVAFYLDGVSFVHKYNPFNAAVTPKSRVWRKKSEGLEITTKGSKELPGGRRVHVMVAIAYGKGVVLRVPYTKMDGPFFAQFIKEHFRISFARAGPKHKGRRLFIMDNDPCQTSKVAMKALEDIEAKMHVIPPRSPDLNPIENIFHIVKNDLGRQAICENITAESFSEFEERILNTLDNTSVDVIDRTIDSMSGRINAVIKSKGFRIKY